MTHHAAAPGLEAHLADRLGALLRGAAGRNLTVWGASGSGVWVCEALQRCGAPFRVVDGSPARQGTSLSGQVVQDPTTLVEMPADVVIIASTSSEATRAIRDRVATLSSGAHVIALVDLVPPAGLPPSVVHLAVDRPRDRQSVQRCLAVQGWAVAGAGIRRVELSVGGRRVTLAYGLARPDVATTLAGMPGALHSGFADGVDLSMLPAGPHPVEITAWSADGRPAVVTRTIERVDAPRRARVPCVFCGKTLTKSRRMVNDFAVMTCRVCGGGSVVSPPDEASCREWYNDADVYGMIARARRQAEESPSHPDAAAIAALLRTSLGPGRHRVLEVGCANGRLLNGLRRHDFEVAGLELSRETSQVARDLFGLDVHTGLLHELVSEAPFDAIVSRHVIEHVPDPEQELRQIRTRLRRGGVLVLVTPNLDSIASRLLGARWEWFIPPLHVHYFTPRALTRLARRTGFVVTTLGTRRGDARPLAGELAAWAGPLRRRGEWMRALGYMAAHPLAAACLAGPDMLSRHGWHEELVAVLEAT